MNFCEECGAKLEIGATVCPECGTPIDMDEAIEVAEEQPSEAQAAEVQQVSAPADEKKPKTGLIIGCICGGAAVVALIVILLVTGVFGGSSDSEQLADTTAVTQAAAATATPEPTASPSPSPSPSPTPEPTPSPTPKPTPKPSYLETGVYEKELEDTIWTIMVEKIDNKSANIQISCQSMWRTYETVVVPCTVKKNKASFHAAFNVNSSDSGSYDGTIIFKKKKVVFKLDGGDGLTVSAKKTAADPSFSDGEEMPDRYEDYEDYEDYDEDY